MELTRAFGIGWHDSDHKKKKELCWWVQSDWTWRANFALTSTFKCAMTAAYEQHPGSLVTQRLQS
jgi:hypothetical protein